MIKIKNISKNLYRFLLLCLVLTALNACNNKTNVEKRIKDEALKLYEQGNYNAAIRKFDEALKVKDLNEPGVLELDILKYRAEAEFKAKDYMAAEHTYEILSQTEEDKAIYKNMRVICISLSSGNVEDAIKLYEEADVLADKGLMHDEALYELGKALIKKGKENLDESYIEKARQLYEKAQTSASDTNVKICSMIGTFYYDIADYEKALEWFEKGLQKDAKNKELIFNQASSYEFLGQYEKALEIFESYIENFGEDEDARHEIYFLKNALSN